MNSFINNSKHQLVIDAKNKSVLQFHQSDSGFNSILKKLSMQRFVIDADLVCRGVKKPLSFPGNLAISRALLSRSRRRRRRRSPEKVT